MSDNANQQAVGTKKTLIDEGTEVKGQLESTCPIVVMGKVQGELTGPSLEVTETGVVSGKAKVKELFSRGELAGEFDAEVVELSGRVRDKTVIRAQSLEVSLERGDGRIEMVFGTCELAVGDAPDKARALADAAAAREAAARPAEPARPTEPARVNEPDRPPETPAADIAAAATAAAEGVPAQEADPTPSGKNGRRPRASEGTAVGTP
jgi:cytoskeletal protein CcmA (bactofilin family)